MSFHNGAGAGHGVSPELQAQLDAAKAMRAGNKSRPGRGRDGGGGGSRFSSLQPGPARPSVPHGSRAPPFPSASLRTATAGFNNSPQPKIPAARFGAAGLGTVSRPTINPPVFKATSPSKIHHNNVSDEGANIRSSTGDKILRDGNSPVTSTMIGRHTIGPLNSVVRGNPSTGPEAPPIDTTAIPSQGSAGAGFHGGSNATMPSGSYDQPTAQVSNRAPTAGRELIVTNWTEDSDKKPFIPSHLQQRSAFQAIQEIADMINQPVDTLTQDGCSIPRPREGARPLNALLQSTNHIPAPRQPDVDPTGWFMAVNAKTNATINDPSLTGQFDNQERPRTVSDSAMDVDMGGSETHLRTVYTHGTSATQMAPGSRSAFATNSAHTIPVATTGKITSRPVDLSGSIWADSSWNITNKKENAHAGTGATGFGRKQAVSSSQYTPAPMSSSNGRPAGNTFANANAAVTPTVNPGSSSTSSVSIQGFPGPAPKQTKRAKNLDDSIWA